MLIHPFEIFLYVLSQIASFTHLWVCFEELRVAIFEDENFRIKQLWIYFEINLSVNAPHYRVHKWTSFLAEFTIEDNYASVAHEGLNSLLIFKEVNLKIFLSIQIHCSFNVTAHKFIIISTIDNDDLLLLILNLMY